MISATPAARSAAPVRLDAQNSGASAPPAPSTPAQTAQVPGQRDEFVAAPARSTVQAAQAAPAAAATPEIGSLSRKYESNGDPGLVSSGVGDNGGRSYGAYQFSSKTGSAAAFTKWLSSTHPSLARDLAGKTPNTPAFDSAWKATAARDRAGFLSAQHDYIKASFYDPAAASVKSSTGLDVSKRSAALRDVLW